METVIPHLLASPPLDLGFGRVPLQARSYVLERDQGNLLVYGAHAVEGELDVVPPIARQYLNHSHEASAASDLLGAPLLVHEADAPETARTARVAHTFSRRHRLDDDFEVIPVPGHTAGATAYLWDAGEHRVLFTGDTLFVRDGEWVAAFLDAVSDRDSYLASLELLGGLDFDLLVPGIAPIGQPAYAFVELADATRRIAAVAERLRRGEDQ